MKPDKKYCVGCHSNFYNGNNEMGVKECWNFKTAKAVKMYCIGWWTPQDKREYSLKITTNSGPTETGRFAYYDKLPEHLTRRVKV